MTEQQEARLAERKALRAERAVKYQKIGIAPHNVDGWEQVTTWLSQQERVQTATENLTAREWLEEEYGRMLSKGRKCKIFQHPAQPSLIALYKEQK